MKTAGVYELLGQPSYISNNCNNISMDECIPRKINGTFCTPYIVRYAHDAVYRPLFWGIHPFTKQLLQPFPKYMIVGLTFYKFVSKHIVLHVLVLQIILIELFSVDG